MAELFYDEVAEPSPGRGPRKLMSWVDQGR
jgi:hypothetical protein